MMVSNGLEWSIMVINSMVKDDAVAGWANDDITWAIRMELIILMTSIYCNNACKIKDTLSLRFQLP